MSLGLRWSKRLIVAAVLMVSIPAKVRFIRRWSARRQEKKKDQISNKEAFLCS